MLKAGLGREKKYVSPQSCGEGAIRKQTFIFNILSTLATFFIQITTKHAHALDICLD